MDSGDAKPEPVFIDNHTDRRRQAGACQDSDPDGGGLSAESRRDPDDVRTRGAVVVARAELVEVRVDVAGGPPE